MPDISLALISPIYFLISLLLPELNIVFLLFTGGLNFDSRLCVFEPISLNHINLLVLIIHLFIFRKKTSTKLITNFKPLKYFFPLLIWFCMNALLLSNHTEYAFDKISVMVFVSMLSGYLIMLRSQSIGSKTFTYLLISIGLVTLSLSAIGFWNMLFSSSENRLAVLGGGPLTLARYSGFALILLFVFHQSVKNKLGKWLLLVFGYIILMTQIYTLSKGPLLFFFCTYVVFQILFVHGKTALQKISSILLMALVIGSTIFILKVEDRLLLNPLTENNPNGSYSSRITFFDRSLSLIKSHPMAGIGLGNFRDHGEIAGLEHDYPHNLFLEITAESGMIGLFLLLLILIPFLKNSYRFYKMTHAPIYLTINLFEIQAIILLTIYIFLNQLVSGDVISGKLLWFFILTGNISMMAYFRESLHKPRDSEGLEL